MKWTYDRVLEFYRRVKRTAACSKCGASAQSGRYVGIGNHPRGGEPVRQCGADILAVKQWIRTAGWACRSCKQGGTAAADGPTTTSPRKKVDALRKELKPFKDRSTEEMRARRDDRIKRMGVEWNEDWERTAAADGRWFDPDELDRKRAELVALTHN